MTTQWFLRIITVQDHKAISFFSDYCMKCQVKEFPLACGPVLRSIDRDDWVVTLHFAQKMETDLTMEATTWCLHPKQNSY